MSESDCIYNVEQNDNSPLAGRMRYLQITVMKVGCIYICGSFLQPFISERVQAVVNIQCFVMPLDSNLVGADPLITYISLT